MTAQSVEIRNGRGDGLRGAAMFALAVGATCSATLTVYSGRHNRSFVLVAIFLAWVLAPYAGMFLARTVAERSAAGIAAAMHAGMIALAVFATGIYALVALNPPVHEAAAPFLVVPAAMWLAIGSMLVGARVARKR